jgi:hypothetical protein
MQLNMWAGHHCKYCTIRFPSQLPLPFQLQCQLLHADRGLVLTLLLLFCFQLKREGKSPSRTNLGRRKNIRKRQVQQRLLISSIRTLKGIHCPQHNPFHHRHQSSPRKSQRSLLENSLHTFLCWMMSISVMHCLLKSSRWVQNLRSPKTSRQTQQKPLLVTTLSMKQRAAWRRCKGQSGKDTPCKRQSMTSSIS